MKSGDPGSNPDQGRFFLVLQLFVWKNGEFFNLNIMNPRC